MVRENWYGDARWRKVEWRTTLASSKSAMGACHDDYQVVTFRLGQRQTSVGADGGGLQYQ
jgi:hypothetical protein